MGHRPINRQLQSALFAVIWISVLTSLAAANTPRTIVLVAGETARVDKVGHHDYLAGCKTLDSLLRQSAGVSVVQVTGGWPSDESIFDSADAIVFYTDGGGKQAFLKNAKRIKKMQTLADEGVGFTMIHQAVDFPSEYVEQAKTWVGGVYVKSGDAPRGHWESQHLEFPTHAITRGIEPWKINDGWLCGIQFVENKTGVTPLVWSGKKYAGSRAGLDPDIVGWAYERKGKGRAFGFTGLDAHSAWSLPGMRQFVVNGVLWTAGIEIANAGAPAEISEDQLVEFLTPRTPKQESGTADSRSPNNRIAVMETAFGKRGDVSSFVDAKLAGYTAIQMHSGQPSEMKKPPFDQSIGLAIGEDPAVAKAWKQASEKHGVKIISLCAGSLNKCEIWDRDRELAMRIAKQTIDACVQLDAKTMLFPFFGPSKFQDSDEALRGIEGFMLELLPYAEKNGVVIGIEAPVTTIRVLELMGKLKFPKNLKIYYDTGNLFAKEDIYEMIRKYAKDHFCEVHMKAFGDKVAGRGRIELAKLAKALDDGGYDGWLVYEANRNGRDPIANRKAIEVVVSQRK